MAVLHGCVMEEKCESCGAIRLRTSEVESISFQPTGGHCDALQPDGRVCRGVMRDTLLDWEDPLPEDELEMSEEHCGKADLVLALGTSLRIEPAGSLPLLAKSYAIVNLQRTPKDAKAALIIRAPVDLVMKTIMREVEGVELKDGVWTLVASHGDADAVKCAGPDGAPAELGA